MGQLASPLEVVVDQGLLDLVGVISYPYPRGDIDCNQCISMGSGLVITIRKCRGKHRWDYPDGIIIVIPEWPGDSM